jgi:preprotein translocase subunit SecD
LKINDSVLVTADYAWEKHIIVQIPLKWNTALADKENIKKAKEAIWKVVRIKFKQIDETATWTWNVDKWMIAKWKGSDWELHNLDERYFVKSAVQFSQIGEPMIELVFNEEWKLIFWDLSTRLVWKRMAIFVGWELLTDPVINEPILWWKAQVTGSYTKEEAIALSSNINTWVVPAPIYLTSEKSIDSKLWSNSLKKLILAWVTGFILIFIFLIYTYRLSWVVASLSLAMYVVIILVIIKSTATVLTLASIAWLILSIGMAIDANILIFERIREELETWKKMSDATRIWFKKSWTAIWDSNITGLVVAMILYVFGINMIKGFWLMLWIWIIVSLFSAMYISRVFVLLLAESLDNKNTFIWK